MAERKHDEPVDKSLTIEPDPESAAALDAAFAASGGDEIEQTPQQTAAPAETAPPADAALPDEKPDGEVGGGQPAEEPPAPEPAVPEPRVPDTKSATPAEEEDPAIKAISEVKLRADASQKTKETFANLKELSAARIREKNAELERIRAEQAAKIEEARKQAIEEARKQAAVPEDVQKELEELRRLRARVDVESDPKFKEQFDAKRDANYEEIYGVLAKFGLKEGELKVLRGLAETDKIENITEFAAKLPPTYRLKVEAKLFDNLNLSDAREKALKDAREQAQKLHAEREQQSKAQLEQQTKAVQDAVAKFKGEAIFKRADIPANTPAEEKKRLEAQNAFIEKLDKLFTEVVNDSNPQAKVEAAYGLVLAHKFKADLDTANARVAALQKELDGIKRRSGVTEKGRLVNVPSEKSGQRPAASVDDADAGSSLDSLAKQYGAL